MTAWDELGPDDLALISAGNCPICGNRGFVIGPAGGAALNVECSSLPCRARYNVVYFSGRALMAHPIPREDEGGSVWPSKP
jgi:hypothetical protein